MHFWSDLGRIKPRNEEIGCTLCLKRLSRGSEVIVELKIWIFHHFGGWSSDRYEGGMNLLYAPETDFGPK